MTKTCHLSRCYIRHHGYIFTNSFFQHPFFLFTAITVELDNCVFIKESRLFYNLIISFGKVIQMTSLLMNCRMCFKIKKLQTCIHRPNIIYNKRRCCHFGLTKLHTKYIHIHTTSRPSHWLDRGEG